MSLKIILNTVKKFVFIKHLIDCYTRYCGCVGDWEGMDDLGERGSSIKKAFYLENPFKN